VHPLPEPAPLHETLEADVSHLTDEEQVRLGLRGDELKRLDENIDPLYRAHIRRARDDRNTGRHSELSEVHRRLPLIPLSRMTFVDRDEPLRWHPSLTEVFLDRA
jgi:hypothetical protein